MEQGEHVENKVTNKERPRLASGEAGDKIRYTRDTRGVLIGGNTGEKSGEQGPRTGWGSTVSTRQGYLLGRGGEYLYIIRTYLVRVAT